MIKYFTILFIRLLIHFIVCLKKCYSKNCIFYTNIINLNMVILIIKFVFSKQKFASTRIHVLFKTLTHIFIAYFNQPQLLRRLRGLLYIRYKVYSPRKKVYSGIFDTFIIYVEIFLFFGFGYCIITTLLFSAWISEKLNNKQNENVVRF